MLQVLALNWWKCYFLCPKLYTLKFKLHFDLFYKLIIIYYRWSFLRTQWTNISTYALHILCSTFNHLQPKEVINQTIITFFSKNTSFVTLILTTILFQFLRTHFRIYTVRHLITIDIPHVSWAVIPLICFVTIEFHQTYRVIR